MPNGSRNFSAFSNAMPGLGPAHRMTKPRCAAARGAAARIRRYRPACGGSSATAISASLPTGPSLPSMPSPIGGRGVEGRDRRNALAIDVEKGRDRGRAARRRIPRSRHRRRARRPRPPAIPPRRRRHRSRCGDCPANPRRRASLRRDSTGRRWRASVSSAISRFRRGRCRRGAAIRRSEPAPARLLVDSRPADNSAQRGLDRSGFLGGDPERARSCGDAGGGQGVLLAGYRQRVQRPRMRVRAARETRSRPWC